MHDLPIDTSGEFAGWIAFYKGEKLEIPKECADSLWRAKLLAMKHFKNPAKDDGLIAVTPAYNYPEG